MHTGQPRRDHGEGLYLTSYSIERMPIFEDNAKSLTFMNDYHNDLCLTSNVRQSLQ